MVQVKCKTQQEKSESNKQAYNLKIAPPKLIYEDVDGRFSRAHGLKYPLHR